MMEDYKVAENEGVCAYVVPCGPLQTNVGVIAHRSWKYWFLIDAPSGICRKLMQEGMELSACRGVWLTHVHWDHIGDVAILQTSRAVIYGNSGDQMMFEHPEVMHAWSGGMFEGSPFSLDVDVQDGEEVELFPGTMVKSLWVPGHSQGSMAYYLAQLNVAFVGDTWFKGGVGRTDLPGGNEKVLMQSIQSHLRTLPKGTCVVPGHGPFFRI